MPDADIFTLQQANKRMYDFTVPMFRPCWPTDAKYFRGLPENLGKLLENPNFTDLFNEKRIKFPKVPHEEPAVKGRKFKEWYSVPYFPLQLYQGDVNDKGQKDGKGILIIKNICLIVCNFKENKAHGEIIQIDTSGSIISETRLNGKLHGQQKTSIKAWSNGGKHYPARVTENYY